MVGTVDITINLQLYKAVVLRGFRSFLNVDRPEHHIVEMNAQRKKEWRKEVDDPPPPPPPSPPTPPLLSPSSADPDRSRKRHVFNQTYDTASRENWPGFVYVFFSELHDTLLNGNWKMELST